VPNAAARGIAAGNAEAVAEISGDATAGVVVAPMGYWPRNSRQRRTVNVINPPAFADYGHMHLHSQTRAGRGGKVDAGRSGVIGTCG